MNLTIRRTRHPVLQKYVPSFIFFKAGQNKSFQYTTFPNTNLCLTLYRENSVRHTLGTNVNRCDILAGQRVFTSRLWGFHRLPFGVNIAAASEQVCLLFEAGALRQFTRRPYGELLEDEDVFTTVFGKEAPFFAEQLFGLDDINRRQLLLEKFLLRRLAQNRQSVVEKALAEINRQAGNIRIEKLASDLHTSYPTLYRQFCFSVGQSPKEYASTVRFRAFVPLLVNKAAAGDFTRTFFESGFYDQPHFIRDFRKAAGLNPARFARQVQLEQDFLVWLPSRE